MMVAAKRKHPGNRGREAHVAADKSELDVAEDGDEIAGAPLLATSYLCVEPFSEEADAFGGAMVLDRDGRLLGAHPLDKTGILYFDADYGSGTSLGKDRCAPQRARYE
jgi:hypothetical protein